ncbi:hypothetical protein ACTXT7_013032 [Hymenolepis weldensis]
MSEIKTVISWIITVNTDSDKPLELTISAIYFLLSTSRKRIFYKVNILTALPEIASEKYE